MLYRDNSDETKRTVQWDNVLISDVKGIITNEAEQAIDKQQLNIYQTEGFGIELYPEGSKEVLSGVGQSTAEFTVTLSKLMTSENMDSDLTFDSSLEIVKRANSVGRPSYTELPGNYVPDTSLEVQELELDTIKERKIIITKPWGENRSTTHILIGIVIATTIASTILLIRQYKKKK